MGHETRQAWDGLDRLVRVTRVAGGDSDDEVDGDGLLPGRRGARRPQRERGGDDVHDRRPQPRGRHRDPVRRAVLTTATTWDANGNKETETDRRGVKRRFVYDDLNRLKAIEIVSGLSGEGPTGTIAEYGYDLVGNKTSETNLAGLTTRFEHDGLYRVTAKVLPETMAAGFTPAGPLTERYRYDSVGQPDVASPTRMAARRPGTTTDSTASRGRRTPSVSTTTVAYNDPEPGAHVNKSEELDLTRGLRTTFVYDPLNRETERQVHLEPKAGVDASVPRGVRYTTATAYDDAAHSVTVTDPRGHETRDAPRRSRPAVRADGRPGRPRARHADELRRPWQPQVRDRPERPHDALPLRRPRPARRDDRRPRPDGRRTAYDGEGLKISETDRRGVDAQLQPTTTLAGRARRASSRWRPSPGSPGARRLRYQDVARKRIEIDARGFATTFDLDGIDRVVKETDALGHDRTFRWDGVNKREETDKRRTQDALRVRRAQPAEEDDRPRALRDPDGRDDVRGRAPPCDHERTAAAS